LEQSRSSAPVRLSDVAICPTRAGMLLNYSRPLTSAYMILSCTSVKVEQTLCNPLDAGWSMDPASGFDLQGKIGKHTGEGTN